MAVIAAISALLLFGIAALVVDLGLGRDTRRQAQNSSDAAALAAAAALYPGKKCSDGTDAPCFADAVAAAKSYAEANYKVSAAEWASCSTTPPSGSLIFDSNLKCVTFDSLTAPNYVWVTMPARTINTNLGSAIEKKDTAFPVGAYARAAVVGGRVQSCGLCFLGSVDMGNGDIKVTGGSIFVNGDLSVGSNSYWTSSGSIVVAGSYNGINQQHMTPDVTPGSFTTDPWQTSSAVPPSFTGFKVGGNGGNGNGNPCGAGKGGDGIYSSLSLSNNQTCALDPGLYVIVGNASTVWLEGNKSVFSGTDVTLYFTCGSVNLAAKTYSQHTCNNELGASLDAKNGDLALKAPTSGPRKGLAIVYDRTNLSELGLQGNGGTTNNETAQVTGAVYAPNSLLAFNGNSCFEFGTGPVIVSGIDKGNGNGSCVNMIGSTSISLPTTPGTVSLDR
ncbi:pilus assembly protein TadG-related protein [Nocardioides marmorisolisilvae]|uniref:pilus assembly protein TadG-related protein n=1 Tax=Nocardioides marmorisolisilvae TaxID=1542737 RepID=UPI00160ABA37|nr:pilus assembly protein TadG-related protein [Nocardioides marmorisolisilvae]